MRLSFLPEALVILHAVFLAQGGDVYYLFQPLEHRVARLERQPLALEAHVGKGVDESCYCFPFFPFSVCKDND